MTDIPTRGSEADPPVETSSSPFHHLFHRVTDAAHSTASAITDKVHQLSKDPHVQSGVHITTEMGVNVVNGVKQDGLNTASDVRQGNYVGAALHVAPLLAGGPVGLVVKEVAPKVLAEGVKQLPPGARYQVESTGAGRVAIGMVEHGRIPTSPVGIAQFAVEGVKRTALNQAITGLTGGRVNANEVQTGYPQQRDYGRQEVYAQPGGYGQPRVAAQLGGLAGFLPLGKFAVGIHAVVTNRQGNEPATNYSREMPVEAYPPRAAQMAGAAPVEVQAVSHPQREVRTQAVNVNLSTTPLVGTHVNLNLSTGGRAGSEAPQTAVHKSSAVFPSWMTDSK